MAIKIMNLELPKVSYDWGTLQINGLTETYFRFTYDEENKVAVLDQSLFVESEVNPDKRHKRLEKESKMYQDIQKALTQHINDGR